MAMLSIVTGDVGRSSRSVSNAAMVSTVPRLSASDTSPKMVCLRLSHAVVPTVMKNCEPLVLAPALAMANRYGRSKAGPERVAALDHEAGDHPVKGRAVIQPVCGLLTGSRVGPLFLALGELDEVAHRLGGVVGEQLDGDFAEIGGQGGVQIVGHNVPSGSVMDPAHPRMSPLRWAFGSRRGMIGDRMGNGPYTDT